MADTVRVSVFIIAAYGYKLASPSTMDDNSNPRSADLGVVVMMAVVPIVVYVVAVLSIPWIVAELR